MRDHDEEIRALGGEVIAIGTGSVKYAAAFVEDEHVAFPVLVDDHTADHAPLDDVIGALRNAAGVAP